MYSNKHSVQNKSKVSSQRGLPGKDDGLKFNLEPWNEIAERESIEKQNSDNDLF